MSKNIALTGVAGYIAPRHLKAIKETGNTLSVAVDPHDSVGILDSYFPDASFFTEHERFERHLEKLRRKGDGENVDMISICSPNNLHDAHIRTALRVGADALCEKPLVLNPWNLDVLEEMEAETRQCIFTVLQLRLHPAIQKLKKQIDESSFDTKCEVDLSYITSRGTWYHYSWKGNPEKSGGVVTNIGIHFFDMLMWLFGDASESMVHINEETKAGGYLELPRARVRWFLSLDRNDLPKEAAEEGKRTYRSITIDGEEVEFSGGFTDLHTLIYQDILEGGGFRIPDARPSIKLVYDIRNGPVSPNNGEMHPMTRNGLPDKDAKKVK